MTSKLSSEILTYKLGKFVFSAKYSSNKLLPLLIESQVLYKTVNDLPVLPRIASQIQKELIKRSIFSTAAIEGNPLSEEKVSQIIENSAKIQNTERAQKEIQNLKNAYDFLEKMKSSKSFMKIPEKLIRNIHRLITLDIEYKDNIPGTFRSHIVRVGDSEHGGVYTPPKIVQDIKMIVKHFIAWINADKMISLDPILRAAIAHYYIGLIHPFADGNGRTARFVEALLLQTSGIKFIPVMLSNFYYQNVDDYYWAFSKSIKNKERDITPFLEFVLRGVIKSLNEIKEHITFHIRDLTLRDYYHFLYSKKKITHRQYDFLIFLIDKHDTVFIIKELFSKSPFSVLYKKVSPSTARRDITNLLKLNLIKTEKNNCFSLNMNALE